jgi:hypothetical protein
MFVHFMYRSSFGNYHCCWSKFLRCGCYHVSWKAVLIIRGRPLLITRTVLRNMEVIRGEFLAVIICTPATVAP